MITPTDLLIAVNLKRVLGFYKKIVMIKKDEKMIQQNHIKYDKKHQILQQDMI